MAKDLMRMLTEITPTQQPTSAVPGTPGFRGMFGQQQAQRLQGSLGSLARGGVPSPQARMGQALAGLDLNKPEDLAKLAKIQQGTGDFAGAAKTAAKIKALRSEEAQATAGKTQRQQFATYLDRTYPDKGYGALALQGVLTPDNMDDFIDDLKMSADFGKGITYTVEDEDENSYTMIPSFSKETGQVKNNYAPLSAGAPPTPVGRVEITGGEFAQTAGEAAAYKLKSDSEREQETTYQEQRVAMVAQMPEINAKYANLQRAEDLLSTVATGGPINIIGTGLETFFGKKPKDKAELEIIFGLEMLKSLKPFFGGVISDSESKRLETIYAGLEKGSEANKGILAALKKELDNAMKKAELYRNAKTFKDFETTIGVMFPAGEVQVDSPNRINFNDLKKG